MMMLSNVAREPELARLMIEIAKSGPPTSFQLVILPVKSGEVGLLLNY